MQVHKQSSLIKGSLDINDSPTLDSSKTALPLQVSSSAESFSVGHATELLCEATRVASSLGSALNLHKTATIRSPQGSSFYRNAQLRLVEQSPTKRREALAQLDVSHLERQIAEAETEIRYLRSQLLINHMTIDLLTAYRFKSFER
ncbi:hypothetical protein Esti_002402 [Eimeria stiedai]